MKLFLTGATGVIGKLLVPQLVAAGHAVSGVSRTPPISQLSTGCCSN